LAALGAWLAILGAVADVIENLCWIRMIRDETYHPYAAVAAWATRGKFGLLALVVACIVVSVGYGTWRWLGSRGAG
jgi:hypothetical protein